MTRSLSVAKHQEPSRTRAFRSQFSTAALAASITAAAGARVGARAPVATSIVKKSIEEGPRGDTRFIGVFPLRFRQRRLPVGCAARDRFLPLMGAPGRVPVQGLCMRKLSTHTARANSTILMHRLCRGFPTSHSRATVSSIYSRIFTAQAVKVSRDTHGSIPEQHKHQNLRVHLAKMVAADMFVAPSRPPLWPAATAACRRARASSGKCEVRIHPSTSEPCSSGDESAPQACGSHSPPPSTMCRTATMVITIVSVQPSKRLHARGGAGSTRHGVGHAKNQPASQRGTPWTTDPRREKASLGRRW